MEEEEEDEDEDVEYREVDPMMAVIEEKIILLESMTQGNPYNDQLDAKHEEYIGLMEELEILGNHEQRRESVRNNHLPSSSDPTPCPLIVLPPPGAICA